MRIVVQSLRLGVAQPFWLEFNTTDSVLGTNTNTFQLSAGPEETTDDPIAMLKHHQPSNKLLTAKCVSISP